jgi:hypothetical protein
MAVTALWCNGHRQRQHLPADASHAAVALPHRRQRPRSTAFPLADRSGSAVVRRITP